MDDLDKMEDELNVLIEKCRLAKVKSTKSAKELKILKEDLRVFMIDSGIKEHNDVKIVRGFSFDVGTFKMDFPELAKIYVQEETKTVTTTYDVFTKKNKEKLRKEHPDAFNQCNMENTPQVRGL